MVALDLFAALMAADIPNRGAIVLAEVLLQTYGPNKPKRGVKAIHLDPAQIEHYTGLHRNNARKAIHELVAANILQPQPDGAYKFNKDYEGWKPGGEPMADRLGGGILRFAASALSRHGIGNAKAPVAIHRDCSSTGTPIQRDSSPNGFLNPTGLGSEGSCQSPGIGVDAYATGDIGGKLKRVPAPASEELEIREIQDTHTERASADSLIPPRKPEDLALIYKAADILASDGRTDHLALDLQRKHNMRGCAQIEGWRWVQAAEFVTDGTNNATDSQRGAWRYLVTVAKNARPGDGEVARSDDGRRRQTSRPSPTASLPDARVYAPDPRKAEATEADKARFRAMPAAVRADIEAAALKANPAGRQFPAVKIAACVEEMKRRESNQEAAS